MATSLFGFKSCNRSQNVVVVRTVGSKKGCDYKYCSIASLHRCVTNRQVLPHCGIRSLRMRDLEKSAVFQKTEAGLSIQGCGRTWILLLPLQGPSQQEGLGWGPRATLQHERCQLLLLTSKFLFCSSCFSSPSLTLRHGTILILQPSAPPSLGSRGVRACESFTSCLAQSHC